MSGSLSKAQHPQGSEPGQQQTLRGTAHSMSKVQTLPPHDDHQGGARLCSWELSQSGTHALGLA